MPKRNQIDKDRRTKSRTTIVMLNSQSDGILILEIQHVVFGKSWVFYVNAIWLHNLGLLAEIRLSLFSASRCQILNVFYKSSLVFLS